MPKVRVFWKCLTDQEKRELLALLEAAGCEILEDEEEGAGAALVPIEEAPQRKNEDVLVVLITPACARDPELAAAARRAVGSGGRVVGVWPNGETDGKIPTALEKYGADVVTWDRAKVARTVQQQGPAQWETVQGTPRAEPGTKRNSC